MTDEELEAVCERHGVRVSSFAVVNEDMMPVGMQWGATDDTNDAHNGIGPTKADAVCALLKARWGITTQHDADCEVPWIAMCPADSDLRHFEEGMTDYTELAAVVALADRLRESGS